MKSASSCPTTFSFGQGGGSSSEIGAAYPNAGDSRIVLFNTDGDRFVRINLTTGAVSDADDIDDLEDGNLPFDEVGAAASENGSQPDTYFLSTDGDTYTKYERGQNGGFDTPASFEEEFDDAGCDLASIGAVISVRNSNHIILFNQNGTQYQRYFYGNDSFDSVSDFPSDFGNGSSPVSAVGAAFFIDGSNQVYLFDRAGERYTVYSSNNGTFTAAFDISELGDIAF